MPERGRLGAWRLAYRLAGGVLGATATVVAQVARGSELNERLGHGSTLPERIAPLWLHGASVGELATIRPIVAEVTTRWPEILYGHTATTPTGRDAAARDLPDAVFTRLLPLDAWPALGRFLEGTHPGAVLIAETELWPGLLDALRRRGVPVALVSARMSARSHHRYLKVRGLFRDLLPELALVAARTADDRDRFIALGADPDRTLVLGNTKLDAHAAGEVTAWPDEQEAALQALLEGRHLVVWGCLRPLEEATAFAAFHARPPGARPLFALAPRHLTEFDRVADVLNAEGFSFVRWSHLVAAHVREPGAAAPPGGYDVLLVDTLGDLRHFYARADVAIVGGTFATYGGHNLMEPAQFGVPVLFGPDTTAWPDDAARLLAASGGARVEDAQALDCRLRTLLAEPELRTRMGRAAREAAESGRGATERIVDALAARGFFDSVSGGPRE